jgi:hypothetical protein
MSQITKDLREFSPHALLGGMELVTLDQICEKIRSGLTMTTHIRAANQQELTTRHNEGIRYSISFNGMITREELIVVQDFFKAAGWDDVQIATQGLGAVSWTILTLIQSVDLDKPQ